MNGPNSNPRAQSVLKEREKLVRRQYDADVREVMGTPQGRRFVWRLIDDTSKFFSVTHAHNPADLGFHNGQRALGAFLWDETMRVCPAESVQMYQEQLAARREAELQKKSAEAQARAETDD